jgi:hypothetical protein
MKTVFSWFKHQRKSRWVDLSSGQAIVIIALAAIGLFAMMGLAIDGGRLLLMKRDTQNAADAAAIAAARALCTGRDPAPFALAAANENGFSNDDPDQSIEVYAPPISPGFAIEDECKGCFVEVVLKSEMQPAFIGLVYDGDMATTSRAIGVCSPDMNAGLVRADSVRAAWAKSESTHAVGTRCTNPIDISGDGIYLNGGLHSNGYIKINAGGDGGIVVGPTSHSQGWDVDAHNVEFQTGLDRNEFFTETPTGPCVIACFTDQELVTCGCWGEEQIFPAVNPYLTPPQYDYPVGYTINDYNAADADGMAAAESTDGGFYKWNCSGPAGKFSDWLVAEHLQDGKLDNGIYYAACDIKINHSELDGVTGNVTFVSTGTIQVNGDGQQWEPFTDDLLLFSTADKGCNWAIKLSGNNNNWNGNVFAPNGAVEVSGATNIGMESCMLGEKVAISGSQITVDCDPGPQEFEIKPALWLAK